MAKVVLENVSRVFMGQSGPLPALTGMNLEIAAGEFLCLVGPSGCGKSTLLNLIAGLEKPDSGMVRVNGVPVAGPGPEFPAATETVSP